MILIADNVAHFSDAMGINEKKVWGLTWETAQFNLSNAELVDLPVPANFVGGRFQLVDGALVADAEIIADCLARDKAAFIVGVDADVDGIFDAAIGSRGPEYVKANEDATAYKAAGYAGSVPSSVSSWATAKAWTDRAAADDILAAAARLEGAQSAIRAARLLRKEQARNAVTPEALEVVRAQWAGFVSAIRSQLGV